MSLPRPSSDAVIECRVSTISIGTGLFLGHLGAVGVADSLHQGSLQAEGSMLTYCVV